MDNPIPLAERFMVGTEWVLTVPYGTIPVGTRVRVEGAIQAYAYDDQALYVPCSFDPEVTAAPTMDIPLDILT